MSAEGSEVHAAGGGGGAAVSAGRDAFTDSKLQVLERQNFELYQVLSLQTLGPRG